MTKQELLRELRKPYWCFVRLSRSSYDGAKFWDRSLSLHKGDLISSIQKASDTEVFNVEIERVEKKTRYDRDTLTLYSCIAPHTAGHGQKTSLPQDSTFCEDCPPPGYTTDKTRCLPCPRRSMSSGE